MFLLQVLSRPVDKPNTSNVDNIYPNRARKKLEFQLVLWASSSNLFLAQGHTLFV